MNSTVDQFVVEIVEDETGEVTWRSKPTYLRRAEKIEKGTGINLDWGKYSTRIVPDAAPCNSLPK